MITRTGIQKTNTLRITTPEGITFSTTLAGPLIRFLAWVIDGACVMTAVFVLSMLSPLLIPLGEDWLAAITIITFFSISTGYGMLLEWLWRGQTLGKRLLGLRVMDEEGLQLRFSQVALRNLLRIVDRLPALYLLGGITCFLSPTNQRLGDLAAGTVVARIQPIPLIDLTNLTGDKYNSFRATPHLEARLRQKVSPHEAALAFDSILRRDEMLPDSRVQLFSTLSAHFQQLVPFPQDITHGLTDEQYIRNVLDSIYNTSPEKAKQSRPTT